MIVLKNNHLDLTDQELIIKIKENTDALGIVYRKFKSNCLGFMRKMTSGNVSDEELEDVFQDANLILYEKIVKGDFVLTAALQTYLNSVCRFQLLNRLGKNKLKVDLEQNLAYDEDGHPMEFQHQITDSLEEIEDPKEAQFTAIENALEIMKTAGGKCYELLTQFWYHKKSMKELAEIFDYSNDKTAKKQKSQCQDKLRVLTFNELKNLK